MELMLILPLAGLAAICLVMIWNQRQENHGKPSLTDRVIGLLAKLIA